MRIVLIASLIAASLPAAAAEPEFEPLAAEKKAVADCLEGAAGETELKQMAACIGIIAAPCPDAPGANTMTIVACHMREQKIWDGYLNEWYGKAEQHLSDDPGAANALKESERAWIAFRDEKCAYWEKRYEGGTFASVMAGDCMRVETGRRALEMRAIFDDLDH